MSSINYLNCNCGYLKTEDEVEELQYWCGDATSHWPEEEGHPRRGRDKL